MDEQAKHVETLLFGAPPPSSPPAAGAGPSRASEVVTTAPTPNPDLSLPAAPPPPDMTGHLLLDRYRLLRKLGVGGMGTVYEAEHVTIKKRCAIKILNPEYAHRTELVERFLQEARAASMIAHENVVEITDFGATPGGSVFFVMEMLNGEDLSATIKREAPLSWDRIVGIMTQICRALQAAHDKGIVHRDMKPENCFRIERSGNPDFIKVLDFGIAKVNSDDGSTGRLTSTGMIFGTPTYMSPEQAQGMRVDRRADVYAVGVILYELVTGKVPFSADNFMGILTKHMFEEPVAPSVAAPEAGVTPEIEAVILKSMQKEPSLRFQSLREMMDAILAVGTGAEAVPVMLSERRLRPVTGPTQFQRPATSPALRAATIETPRRRGGLLLTALALAAVAGGAAAVVLALSGPDQPEGQVPRDTPPVAVAAPPAPEGKAPVIPPEVTPPETKAAEKTPDPPPAATVRVIFDTNVPAEVYDAAGEVRLGASGEPGVALTGAAPFHVLLRAAGHDDLPVDLASASEGQRLAQTLRRSKKVAVTKTPTKTKDPETKQDPPPETKAEGTHTGPKFGLKDPFKTGQGG